MPTDDFVTMTLPMRMSLNPALNVLNGMIMLGHCGDDPSRFEKIARGEVEKEEIDLIFNGLYHGVIPGRHFADFPAYLQYMKNCDPMEIRDKILAVYIEKHNWKSGILKDIGDDQIKEEILSSWDKFLDFLSGGFDPAHYDVEIEKAAFRLLNNTSEMKERIISLLTFLWEKHFKKRWEETKDDLKDFIGRSDIAYLRKSTKKEAIIHMTGVDLHSGKMDFFLRDNPPVEFVPTYDVENGYSKIFSAGILYIFFDPLQFEKRRLDAQLNSLDELSRKLGAIADPNRLNILKYIMGKGEACSQDILKDMGFSQSAVSRHLKMLSDSGILSERRQMSAKYYRVNGEYMRNILGSVTGFLGI